MNPEVQAVFEKQIADPKHVHILVGGVRLSHSEEFNGRLRPTGIPVRFTRLAATRLSKYLSKFGNVTFEEVS